MYPFGSTKHFLDLQFTKEEHDVAARMLNNIIEEGFYITKYTHTAYTDVSDITPFERRILIKLISDDIEAKNKAHEEAIKSIKDI